MVEGSCWGPLIPSTLSSYGTKLYDELLCAPGTLREILLAGCWNTLFISMMNWWLFIVIGEFWSHKAEAQSSALPVRMVMAQAALLLSVGKLLGRTWKTKVHWVIHPLHLSGFPSNLSGACNLGSEGSIPRDLGWGSWYCWDYWGKETWDWRLKSWTIWDRVWSCRCGLKLESVHQESPRSDIFWERATKPLLKQKDCQKHLIWAKEKKNWTLAHWSKVLFSDKSTFCI